MPIKTDCALFDLSPCGFGYEAGHELPSGSRLSSEDFCVGDEDDFCEDMWKKFDDYLLTPPQSPPITFELVSDLVDHINGTSSSDTLLGLLNCAGDSCSSSSCGSGGPGPLSLSPMPQLSHADVLHDCMWSGQCNDDSIANNASSSSIVTISSRPIAASGGVRCVRGGRPETPIAASSLGTSPISTMQFAEFMSTAGDDDLSAEDMDSGTSSMDDDDDMTGSSSQASSPNSSSYHSSASYSSRSTCSSISDSLMNDHCYGSYSHHQSNSAPTTNNSKQLQSLIYPSSCHKSKVQKARGSGSRCSKNGEETSSKRMTIKAQAITANMVPSTTVKFVKGANGHQHFIVKKSSSIVCASPSSNKSLESNSRKCGKVTARRNNNLPSLVSKSDHKRQVTSVQKATIARHSPQKVHHSAPSTTTDDPDDDDDDDDEEDMQFDSSKSSTANKSLHPLRRREHNDSERKRRDHLRNAFIALKDQIPKLKSADKRPPRIMILHEATSYVNHLNEKERCLQKTLDAEAQKREILLRKLSQLEERVFVTKSRTNPTAEVGRQTHHESSRRNLLRNASERQREAIGC